MVVDAATPRPSVESRNRPDLRQSAYRPPRTYHETAVPPAGGSAAQPRATPRRQGDIWAEQQRGRTSSSPSPGPGPQNQIRSGSNQPTTPQQQGISDVAAGKRRQQTPDPATAARAQGRPGRVEDLIDLIGHLR